VSVLSQGEYNHRLSIGSDRQVALYLSGSTAAAVATSNSLSTGAWHHVAATVNAANVMKIYVDGVEAASGTHSITSWTPPHTDLNLPLAIGTLYPYGTGTWSYPTHAVSSAIRDILLFLDAPGRLRCTVRHATHGQGFCGRDLLPRSQSRERAGRGASQGGGLCGRPRKREDK
jgi:hypothetical protein